MLWWHILCYRVFTKLPYNLVAVTSVQYTALENCKEVVAIGIKLVTHGAMQCFLHLKAILSELSNQSFSEMFLMSF